MLSVPSAMKPTHLKLRVLLVRGTRKACPHCGHGGLFKSWFRLHDRCDVCDYEFEPHPGDTWGFWIVGDRILIGVAIVALYFGFTPESWIVRGFFLFLVTAPLVWTMPHRKGICVALDYYSRVKWGDPSEEFPEIPEKGKLKQTLEE